MAQSYLHIVDGLSDSADIVDNIIADYKLPNKPEIFSSETVDVKSVRSYFVNASKRPLDDNDMHVVFLNIESVSNVIANTILKVLEEPPPYLHIHLVTSNEGRVLPTLVSRCQRVRHGVGSGVEFNKWDWEAMTLVEKLGWADALSKDEDMLGSIKSWAAYEKSCDKLMYAREIERLYLALSKKGVNKRLILENFVLNH